LTSSAPTAQASRAERAKSVQHPLPELHPWTIAILDKGPEYARAKLIQLTDLLPECGGTKLTDGRWGFERCGNYWSADPAREDHIPPVLSRDCFDDSMVWLKIRTCSRDHIARLGMEIRTKKVRGYGFHFAMNDLQIHLTRRIVAELHVSGLTCSSRDRSGISQGETFTVPIGKRSGRTVYIHCPTQAHEDADPSAHVNPSGVIYCYGCKKSVAIGHVHGDSVTLHLVQGSGPRVRSKSPRVMHGGDDASPAGPAAPFGRQRRHWRRRQSHRRA